MTNTKRLFCLLLSAAMVLCLLAGCGAQSEETQPTAVTTEPTAAPTVLPELTVPDPTVPETEPPETHLTIGAFRERLNAGLKAADIPLEYRFISGETYGHVKGIAMCTDPNDPFFDKNGESILHWFDLSLGTNYTYQLDDCVITFMQFCGTISSLPLYHSTYMQMVPVVVSALDETVSDEDLELMTEAGSGKTSEPTIFQTDDFSFEIERDVLVVTTPNLRYSDEHIPHGAELLDPKYLEFDFSISVPMVVDGVFNNQFQYYHKYHNYTDPQADPILDVLNDFLLCTCTPLEITHYSDSMYGTYLQLDSWDNALRPSVYFLCAPTGDEITFSYSINEQHFSDYEPEQVIRAAIGLGMILDQEMTLEEAIQLHTHTMEPATTQNGWQITYYCPREVMHIVMLHPDSENVIYDVMTKECFESINGPVEEYVP